MSIIIVYKDFPWEVYKMINSTDNVKELFCKGQLEAVNKTTTDNATPILIAAQEGHEDCIKLLLTHNANPNIPVTEYMGVAAHFAIYKEHAKSV